MLTLHVPWVPPGMNNKCLKHAGSSVVAYTIHTLQKLHVGLSCIRGVQKTTAR